METDCFTRVFGDEMKGYLEMVAMSAYPDQVVIKKEESSGDELQEEILAGKKKKRNLRKKGKDVGVPKIDDPFTDPPY